MIISGLILTKKSRAGIKNLTATYLFKTRENCGYTCAIPGSLLTVILKICREIHGHALNLLINIRYVQLFRYLLIFPTVSLTALLYCFQVMYVGIDLELRIAFRRSRAENDS